MTGRGRPFRFLALVFGSWIGIRALQLLPQAASLPEAIKALSPLPLPVQAAEFFQTPATMPADPSFTAVAREAPFESPWTASLVRAQVPAATATLTVRTTELPSSAAQPALGGLAEPPKSRPVGSTSAQPDHFQLPPDRWSASAWLAARAGNGLGAAPGGSQLGGSQAGARLAYLLVPSAKVAAFVRVTTPLRGRGAEAAAGLEWQPSRVPLRVVVERRVGLDGTTGGFGAGVVGGTDGEIAPGFRLESYGQAGAIRRTRLEPYADGAVRVTQQVGTGAGARLAVGGGIWGAAQRDAARLDIGPSITLAVPVGTRSVRVALDWRQRVAGDARPGSGLALTLGSDF